MLLLVVKSGDDWDANTLVFTSPSSPLDLFALSSAPERGGERAKRKKVRAIRSGMLEVSGFGERTRRTDLLFLSPPYK